MNEISQSAVSQHIQELEKAHGSHFLDRSTRPLVVTEAGQLYLAFCRDVLRRKDEFDAALEQLKNEVEGTVRVASIYSVGLNEMVQLEQEFARRQPNAKLEVEYLRPEKVYSAVLTDEADLGLVSYPESSREITVIPWRREEMVLAASPYHPLAAKNVITPAELNGVDFIGFDEELPIRREVDRFFREHQIEVNQMFHFDNLQMIKEAVEHRSTQVPNPCSDVRAANPRTLARTSEHLFGTGVASIYTVPMRLLSFLLPCLLSAQVVRTADPVKRGFRLSDFPRTVKVTDNVYTYEDFHSGAEKFTTTNMFVVTNDGVFL